MTRDITGAAITAIEAKHVPLAFFVELDFAAGPEYLCNAAYDFVWDSKTWKGLGYLGKISTVKESADMEAAGITLELSGIPPAAIAQSLGEHYQGRRVRIWFAPLDPDDFAIIADPILIFKGRLDTMNIEMGGMAIITATAESRMADWDRARTVYYNDADQKAKYPDDTGLMYIEKMVESEAVWGMM